MTAAWKRRSLTPATLRDANSYAATPTQAIPDRRLAKAVREIGASVRLADEDRQLGDAERAEKLRAVQREMLAVLHPKVNADAALRILRDRPLPEDVRMELAREALDRRKP